MQLISNNTVAQYAVSASSNPVFVFSPLDWRKLSDEYLPSSGLVKLSDEIAGNSCQKDLVPDILCGNPVPPKMEVNKEKQYDLKVGELALSLSQW
ncbi:hypothetical protein V6N13_136784 [Hibiscus sabdariffa]